MRDRRVQATVLGALTFVEWTAAGDDVMRCGNGIVDVGMIAAQVVAKCGTPQSKEVGTAPGRGRGGRGTAGATRVERWTYDRGYGQFPALLTFEHGKLASIELLAR